MPAMEDKRKGRRVRWAKWLAIALLLTSSGLSLFAWGFLSHHRKIFPYSWAISTARKLDVLAGPADRELNLYRVGAPDDALTSLPYAVRTYDPQAEQRGVILHDETQAFQGLNFYSSFERPAAFLLDMNGELLHQWRHRGGAWQHATLLPSGEVLVIVHDEGLYKLSLDSELLWSYEGRAHHDLWVHRDGRIFVLTRRAERLPYFHDEHPIVSDYITILSSDGEVLEEISLIELFRNSSYDYLLPRVGYRTWAGPGESAANVSLDILHTNHVEGFDGSQADQFPAYRDGNLLLSMRHLNTIAIANLAERRIVWAWGPGTLVLQHHPTVLENGNILIFNNRTRISEVLEVDPRTRKVVWFYGRDWHFFSKTMGSSFRLPNGNTLITESTPGYAFEVTPEGEKVWEFANPRVNEEGERTAIWRMSRFTPEELPFLFEEREPQ